MPLMPVVDGGKKHVTLVYLLVACMGTRVNPAWFLVRTYMCLVSSAVSFLGAQCLLACQSAAVVISLNLSRCRQQTHAAAAQCFHVCFSFSQARGFPWGLSVLDICLSTG